MVSDSGLLWWFVGEFAFGCFCFWLYFGGFLILVCFAWLLVRFGWFECGWCGFAILCLITGF